MPKALLLENIHPDAAQSLRDHGFEVECLRGALNEDELIDALEDVDLLGIRSKTSVTSKVIDARPTLTPSAASASAPIRSISTMRQARHRRVQCPIFQHSFRGGTGYRRHHLPDAPHSCAHPSYEARYVGQVCFRLS